MNLKAIQEEVNGKYIHEHITLEFLMSTNISKTVKQVGGRLVAEVENPKTLNQL